MTKTIEPKIWTYKVVIISRSYTAFFVLHFVLLTKPFYWVPVEDTNFYKVVIRSRSYIDYCTRAVILIIVLVFELKNHLIVLVLLIRPRLIMTKTFVHWTEDMIQSRRRLAQLYGILRIALRSCYWQNHFIEYSCYWQNHFIEYSCYLQNHLWTTAELTADNRLSPYARNALHRYVINMSSHLPFPDIYLPTSWQCFYWLSPFFHYIEFTIYFLA
jgi:hypothetical protein